MRDQSEPLTLGALVRMTGLHENTVREHLNGLLTGGLIRRHASAPSGRGRPAWRYESLDSDPDRAEYAGLAAALSRAIVRESSDADAAAGTAGEEWGRDLARERGASTPVDDPDARKVVTMLDDLGFEPRQDPASPADVRLTRCPLLEAAYRHPEVVCAVHLGLVRGALDQFGVDPDGARLVPFAEPGACLLVLPQLRGAAPPTGTRS